MESRVEAAGPQSITKRCYVAWRDQTRAGVQLRNADNAGQTCFVRRITRGSAFSNSSCDQ